ncbi:hypothetical protein MPER_03689, partial [Moniliophthora perniciosa FA553]
MSGLYRHAMSQYHYSGAQLEQIASLEQGVADSWETSEPDAFFDKTLIGGGLMRFQFDSKNIEDSSSLVLYTGPTLGMAWLPQADRFSGTSIGSLETFIPCLAVQLDVASQHGGRIWKIHRPSTFSFNYHRQPLILGRTVRYLSGPLTRTVLQLKSWPETCILMLFIALASLPEWFDPCNL